MAKLLIFRGDAQLDARELSDQTVRIGRGAQNDIILEDPGKGVSRNHAELRFEGGRYTLVDLQSQNGIWVSGERVPSVVLEPGVSAALGPFRLMVEAPVASPATVISTAPIFDPPTELTQMSSRPAAPLELDNLAPPPPTKPAPVPPAPPKPPAAKPVVAKPAAVKPAAKSTGERPSAAAQKDASGVRAWYADPRILAAAVAAVVLIALSAFIGFRFMRGGAKPTFDAVAAQQLVDSGQCTDAMERHIKPALQADPNNQQALALQNRCNTVAAPTTSVVTSSIPPELTADEKLNGVEPVLVANVAADCETARATIQSVLDGDPNNERAKNLLVKANACINPPPARGIPPANPVATDKPAVAESPSKGGLDVLPGETEKAYRSRIATMKKKYDDAVAILGTQNYVQAMKALDEIVPDVPTGYLELTAKRDEARTGIRNEAKAALGRAQAAEGRGELDVAADSYRRAHQLDQSLPVDDAIQRITNNVKAKCDAALVDLAFDSRNQAALSTLQTAVKVLPPTDKCAVTAREKLQQTRK